MAESKCNATIIDNFTLETYLYYSNINLTGKSIHSLLNKKTIRNLLLDYDSACWHVFYNIYIFVSKHNIALIENVIGHRTL